MSDELNPQRLDAILDGTATPQTDDERAMLRMAADLREAAPGPSDALRERVLGLGEPVTRAPRIRMPLWKRVNVMAPALGALVAAVVAVGVVTSGGGGDPARTAKSGGAAGSSEVAVEDSQAPEAPRAATSAMTTSPTATFSAAGQRAGAVTVTVEAGGLDQAIADVESAAGGPDFAAQGARTATSAEVTVTVPADRDAEVVRALHGIGDWSDPAALTGHVPGTPIILNVVEATEGP